ncbi:hypothetical protein [Geothrix sp. 21YS21S-4]|uniref:hypothetical protein n=1 Tax=Geothrix sp. 21YS21S-4 TaxID=3068889 RepID=UPI0027BA34E5|nr:hypothetical protein [Geothrix sp. 21YS21S-4]
MGLRRALQSAVVMVLMAAVGAWAAPAPQPAVIVPVLVADTGGTIPAVALSHRAVRLFAALSKGDAEAVRATQVEIEALRRTYSALDVTPLVEAAAFWAREQGIAGRPAVGLEALQAVERWAPDHPTLLGTRVILMRQEGVQGWFWSFPDVLRLTRLRMEHPAHRWLWLVQHLGMLRLGATLLIWGWAMTMALRYRNVFRHLWEDPLRRRGVGPVVAALVGAGILAAPVILGLDPLVAAMLWLILLAPFLLGAEVKVTVFLLLLQLVHPVLAFMEPWSAREPAPSLVTLQLQPQVRPVSAETLRFLPPEDRAFLKGWAQLQDRAWKPAEATFQALVGHHPDQAEVLNNLGVAKFQMGDGAGAERAFEAALQSGPRMTILLNQSILFFNRLETDLGASKRDAAQAADPGSYARLIALNDAQKDIRTYPMPLLDTPPRLEALADAGGGRKREELPFKEPAFLLGMILPLVGAAAFLGRLKASVRMAHPTQCIRCGEPFHTTDSPDPDVCPKCHHLFVLRDGLHTESRIKKLDEVAHHQRTTRWIHKALIVLLPGCDLAFLGETREGLMEFVPFCLLVGMVLATGRSVRYPGEILADPASTWLTVGAVLAGLFYLRSWLKLILRRD